MSDPLESPESILRDFNYIIDDLYDFILSSKKRALNDSQRKLIIKNKLSQLKNSYNILIRHMTMESEARSNVLFESIHKLTNILNSMDFSGTFELIWYEINALINSFASALVTLHSEGDLWTIQGSAALLVQIIIGLPKIDHLPELLCGSTDDPEYLDRWKVTFNCLQFSATTYIEVINSIKTVGISDLISWANQSFFYLSLLDEYISIFEYDKIASVLKSKPDYYYKMIFIMCNSLQYKYLLSRAMMLLLGAKFSPEIDTLGVLEDRSIGGLMNLINNIKSIFKHAIDKINEIYKTGIWSMNDNPMQAGFVKDLDNNIKLYDYNYSYFESLKTIEPEFQRLANVSNNETIINSMTNNIKLNNWVISNFEEFVGSRENILNTPIANLYITALEQRFEILGLLAVCTKNDEFLVGSFKDFNDFILSSRNSKITTLSVKKFFVELFVATKLMQKDRLEVLYSQIQDIQDLTIKSPRDYSVFVILEYILGYLLDKQHIPTKDEILIKINKNGFIASGDYHLVNEFQEYVEYIVQILNGEEFFLSEALLTRKAFFNIVDSNTWLIPDFNVVFKDKLHIPLYYLPFNRHCDGLVNPF